MTMQLSMTMSKCCNLGHTTTAVTVALVNVKCNGIRVVWCWNDWGTEGRKEYKATYEYQAKGKAETEKFQGAIAGSSVLAPPTLESWYVCLGFNNFASINHETRKMLIGLTRTPHYIGYRTGLSSSLLECILCPVMQNVQDLKSLQVKGTATP